MSTEYRITCDCGCRMRVTEANIGRSGTCPKCQKTLYVDPEAVELWSRTPAAGKTGTGGATGTDWHVGDVILNLYEVKAFLGQGGMGKVYRVFHRVWKQDLAVKCPKPRLLARAGGAENFERECATWVNLGLHPYTVSCYYVRRVEGIPHIFAEYVAGGSLLGWIKKGALYRGSADEALARIVSVAIQVAWGLHHAHEQGLVHRDVKVSNVLLTPDTTAKVTDFGLAKAFSAGTEAPKRDTSGEHSVVSVAGMTPAYCSPEQQSGDRLTRATDVWGWALCLLEMVAGRVFWDVGTDGPEALQHYLAQPAAVGRVPEVPRMLRDLLQQSLTLEPSARPATMIEAADALRQVYEELTGRCYPRTPPQAVEGRAENLNNRAVSLVDLGKAQEAERCWREALTISPQHPESTYNIELMQWRGARTTDVPFVQRLRELTAVHPGDPLPAYLLAQAHLERGDWGTAIRLLEDIQDAEEFAQDVGGLLRMARGHYGNSSQLLRSLDGHADAVTAVCVLPDSKLAASGSEDNTIRLWDLASGDCVRVYEGHAGSVRAVSIDCDGDWLLSGGDDRTLRLWDVPTGECARVLAQHAGAVTAAVFFRDGIRALSGSADHTAIIWRLDLEHAVRVLEGHHGAVTAVGTSGDGELAATASADGTVRLWEVRLGTLVRTLKAHDGGARCLWLRDDGKVLLSGGGDGVIRFWRTEEGEYTRTFEGHRGAVESVAMSADGRYVVSGARDATARIWDAITGRCLRTFDRHAAPVTTVALTKGGSHLLSGSEDTTVKLWRMGSDKARYMAPLVLCRALRSEEALTLRSAFDEALARAHKALGENDAVTAAARVREARELQGYRRNSQAMEAWFRLYRKLPRTRLAGAWEGVSFEGHQGKVAAIRLNADATRFVSAGEDQVLRLWETVTGKCLRTLKGHGAALNSVSLTGDGRFALATNEGGSLVLWDLETGRRKRLFQHLGLSIEAACITGDGRFAVSVGWQATLWDVASGHSIRTFPGSGGDALSVCLSRDGRAMLTGGAEGALHLWDMVHGTRVRAFKGHTGAVRCIQLSADGTLALSGSSSPWDATGELVLWEVGSARCVRRLDAYGSGVTSLALSEDNRFVVSGHKDGAVLLWDARTGERVHQFKGHGAGVEDICLARDGRFLVVAEGSGTLTTWVLDWALQDKTVVPWENEAQPYLETFVLQHAPPAGALPADRQPTEKEIARALTRRGRATWTDADFAALMDQLGCAGYGYLEPDSVRACLDRTAARARTLSRRRL